LRLAIGNLQFYKMLLSVLELEIDLSLDENLSRIKLGLLAM
jgi:hypothetical protein